MLLFLAFSICRADRLLDPTSPLQLIIDQSGVEIGYDAVTTAVDVLRGRRPGEAYEVFPIEHRVLTQDDTDAVKELLGEASSIDAD